MVPLVSPKTGVALRESGERLVSADGAESFPIVKGIPRFVDSHNYAGAFGHQWTVHSDTQLDSRTGTSISRDRLERCLGQPIGQLRGLSVIEAGCGAGRFTECMVDAGAEVHAIDLSVAVEANHGNIGARPNYVVAQASLLEAPFPNESFDRVVCLGVLQHTPSPEESIRALWGMLKPGGALVIDHYTWELSIVTKLAPVYRHYLKRLPPEKSKRATDALTRAFFPLHWAVRRARPAQLLLSRVSPCEVYFRAFPELSKEQHYEFCRLDTYDHLTDYYKHLRTPGRIRRQLCALGGSEIHVVRGGNGVEARCIKPVV